MFKRFSVHQVLFACFAAAAVLPGLAVIAWDDWIVAHEDDRLEWVGHVAILLVGAAIAVCAGWMLARHVAREEAKLRRQQQQLAQAMRLAAMGEMASAIAHEINQPLAAVAAYIDGSMIRLKGGEAPGVDILDALDKAAEQARRAGTILRRVRSFVYDQASQRVLLDLNTPVRDGLELARNELRVAQAELDTSFTDSALPVHADAIQIQQIVVNLVRIVLEAMRDAPVGRRSIRIVTACESDGTVRLAIGNSAAKVARVSETRTTDPFFATEAGRVAMRIRICRALAESHQGKLVIERPADGGAFFELILPLGKLPHE